MTISLRILGWEAQGLRCPDHKMDCCNSQGIPFPVTLIQMPNGTGKTTTLELLRTAISGSAQDWNQDTIKKFRKRNSKTLDGSFSLRLSLNNQLLTMSMDFDFEFGRVDYYTTWGSGKRQVFDPPRELRQFMNPEFVNFYIFDGEYAENLMNPDYTDAQFAIESLFQLNLLKQMQTKVGDYWDEQTKKVTAKSTQGLTRRKNLLDEWKKRLVVVQHEKFELDKRLRETNENLSMQEDKYRKEIEKEQKLAEAINAAETAVEDLKKSIQEKSEDILDEMRDPNALSPNFAKNILDLKSGLDRVKLPANAAREFFHEIASELECICGRTIDKDVSKVIEQRAQQYLGSDDVALLNSIKSTIADRVGESENPAAQKLSDSIESLTELSVKLQNAKNDRDELHITAGKSDPAVKKADEETQQLKRELASLKVNLEKFNNEDKYVNLDNLHKVNLKKLFSIETLNEGIEQLELQVSEVTNTLELRAKRDVLKEIIERVQKSASEAITAEICSEANQRIQELMPYNNIRINRINKCLELQGQAGSSVGETLSVGYAFLATLFKRAERHELPFVVDSPANPIDLEIRAQIGELIPHLTGQFIAFMISSERESFLDKMRETKNETDIKYITLFRKSAEELDVKAKENPRCFESTDGLMVTDKQYFDNFQLDSEDN